MKFRDGDDPGHLKFLSGQPLHEVLRVMPDGRIFYYGKEVGCDAEISDAVNDIVSTERDGMAAAVKIAAWAITELLRRKQAT